MHDVQTQQRFVQLRATGWSFARIASELNVSRGTLIHWSRKFQFEIQNQRAILLEHLQEKWLSACDARVASLGEQLQKVETELAKRDISTMATNQLFYLAESLRRQIKREIGPMTFTTPVSDIPGNEHVSEVQD